MQQLHPMEPTTPRSDPSGSTHSQPRSRQQQSDWAVGGSWWASAATAAKGQPSRGGSKGGRRRLDASAGRLGRRARRRDGVSVEPRVSVHDAGTARADARPRGASPRTGIAAGRATALHAALIAPSTHSSATGPQRHHRHEPDRGQGLGQPHRAVVSRPPCNRPPCCRAVPPTPRHRHRAADADVGQPPSPPCHVPPPFRHCRRLRHAMPGHRHRRHRHRCRDGCRNRRSSPARLTARHAAMPTCRRRRSRRLRPSAEAGVGVGLGWAVGLGWVGLG